MRAKCGKGILNRGFMMIEDFYGRTINSLRISVTSKCNLHCFYCHHEGGDIRIRREMTVKDIQKIVGVIATFDVKKIKLTGGEPLLRIDILDVVHKIKGIQGISEVSMTTNGTLLEKFAKPLKKRGLARVNVSLDTLDQETYKLITGTDMMENAIAGIDEATKVGLLPLKVNMVILKGINADQIWDMIDFAMRKGLILQLIELESAYEDDFYQKYHFDLSPIENELKENAKKIIVRRMHHRKKYFLDKNMEVEVVKPMHNTEFCKYCTRMRITSDGKFKPCLFRSDNLVDFLGPIRNDPYISDENLKDLFIRSVKKRKPYFL